MPSSDRYIHFFKSFFGGRVPYDSLDMYKDHPIKYQHKDISPGISFVHSAHLRITFLKKKKNRSTVYIVKRQHTASLYTCIKTEISTVFTETSSFKETLINTDCVGEIGAKVAQTYLITHAASKERYCS